MDNIPDPSGWVRNSEENYEKHLTERQENGFSYADWYNFDTFIAWVISNAVKKFRDEGHTSFYYPDTPEERWEGLTRAEYDVMIDGFGRYAKASFVTSPEEAKQVSDNLDAALEIFVKRFRQLWD